MSLKLERAKQEAISAASQNTHTKGISQTRGAFGHPSHKIIYFEHPHPKAVIAQEV